MFFRILKKDLNHKRGINFILFLFMIMATIFVASSVNNIFVVSHAMEYCMEKGAVSDIFVSTYKTEGEKSFEKWLDGESSVKNYTENKAVIVGGNNIESFQGKSGSEYDINGNIMLQSQWKENMLIFDTKGNLVQMQKGCIGMQQKELDRNGLKLGDTISFKFRDLVLELEITTVVMDPAFGGDFVGMTRYLVSDEDFDKILQSGVPVNYNYCINSYDNQKLIKAINKEAFNVIVTIEREMFQFSYVMKMITAGILIVVGICLIVMAFLILRFTIQFTLQEDYKEIGIMKAIGIKNSTIKKIYLVKYFALISVAAVLGCFLSIPVSNIMLQTIGRTMLLENAAVNIKMNMLCAGIVALIVLVLCWFSTNRLKKYTAISAIRSGQSGERFYRKSVLKLHRCRNLKTPFFLAMNDILSNIKQYVVLILTFAMGMIIIILPLNTVTSLSSDEMADNFVLDTKADFFMSGDYAAENTTEAFREEHIQEKIDEFKENFAGQGYDVDINVGIFYYLSFYAENEEDVYQIMTIKPLGSDGSYVVLTQGSTPVRENEVVLSERLLKKMGLAVGDSIFLKTSKGSRKMIICGAYQNYMQMGESAFVGEKTELSEKNPSGLWLYQCYLQNMQMNEQILADLKEKFPDYVIYDVQEAMATQLGSTGSQLDMVKWAIIVIICIVNVMITALMMKIFIVGEKSQIAMLRSIGYSIRAIRLWQMFRMGIAMLFGILIGELLSIPLNTLVLRPIFAMMGASHMKIQVNPLQVYLIYPLLLLVVISIAAYISSASVRKMNLMEINNVD